MAAAPFGTSLPSSSSSSSPSRPSPLASSSSSAATLPPPAPPPSSMLPPFPASSPPPTSSPSPFPPYLPSDHRLPTSPSPLPCSPATLDPEPVEEITTSNPSTKVGGREGGRDRRRAVRIAWEKLVRWSRSWRSQAKSDVLELLAEAELSARVLLGVGDALRWSGCCFGADRLSVALRRDEVEVRSPVTNTKAVVIEGVGVAGGGRPWSALVPYCSQLREAPEICSLDPSGRTFYL